MMCARPAPPATPIPPSPAAAAPSITERLRALGSDIKIAHSIFALPFALLGGAMAAVANDGNMAVTGVAWRFALIVLAMIFARTSAMLANRVLDRRIDAMNPRTRGRALPAGLVSVRDASLVWASSSLGFVLIAAAFGVLFGNWWPLFLSVPILLWLCAYGLLKRWTVLCHLYLGISLAMSPPAAALAMHPPALSSPGIWLLSIMVVGWVAGFDIIYALQDEYVDRAEGLHSIPARFGTSRAIGFSRLFHASAATALVATWWIDERLGTIFGAAVVLTVGLLIAEQASVSRWGTRRIALTFFTINGIVSCLVGAAGIVDLFTAG